MATPRMIEEEHGTSTGFRHPHDRHRAGAFARLVAEPRTDLADLPQYSLARVLGTWAAAALPMAVVAWVVAPLVAGTLDGPDALPRVLIVGLGAGMVWQFALVLILVWREQRSLRWSVLQRALWLQAPQSPRTGRRGGRLWLLVIPLVVLLAAKESLPSVPAPAARDFGRFLGSAAGQQFLSGNWLWLALIVTMFVFNTVLGEELFFRGLLLPRMHGVFGRWDWAANGSSSPPTTCTSPGRSRRPFSTRSSWPTPPGGTAAPSSASPCTARRASYSASSCSSWCCSERSAREWMSRATSPDGGRAQPMTHRSPLRVPSTRPTAEPSHSSRAGRVAAWRAGEHGGNVLEQLQPAVEGAAVDHLEGDSGDSRRRCTQAASSVRHSVRLGVATFRRVSQPGEVLGPSRPGSPASRQPRRSRRAS